MNITRFNTYFIFAPLLILYGIIIYLMSDNVLLFDERRYHNYSKYLINFINGEDLRLQLWCGIGYPLFLLPWVYIKAPLILLKLLNGILYFFSVIFLYKSLRHFISKYIAVFIGLIWGLYYPAFDVMRKVLTESLAIFLISLFSYLVITIKEKPSNKKVLLAGLVLAYLALTKIIFGYVVYICFGIFILVYIFKKTDRYYIKRLISIHLIAIIFTLPYLITTYQYTSKIFYWGSSGGNSLYSMSSPYSHELGSWIPYNFIYGSSRTQPSYIQKIATEKYQQNHKDVIAKIKVVTTDIQRDSIFKSEAIKNILQHPKNYAINWTANISRMLFRIPFSYYQHDMLPVLYIIPNTFVFVFIIFSLILSFFYWRKIGIPIKTILLIFLIYLFLTSLLSAFPRQFYIIIPPLLVWIINVFQVFLKDIKKGQFDEFINIE